MVVYSLATLLFQFVMGIAYRHVLNPSPASWPSVSKWFKEAFQMQLFKPRGLAIGYQTSVADVLDKELRMAVELPPSACK